MSTVEVIKVITVTMRSGNTQEFSFPAAAGLDLNDVLALLNKPNQFCGMLGVILNKAEVESVCINTEE